MWAVNLFLVFRVVLRMRYLSKDVKEMRKQVNGSLTKDNSRHRILLKIGLEGRRVPDIQREVK